jgi:hypothetical protein
MSLSDRLSRLRLERLSLMARIAKLPPRSQARTVASHRLTIITADVLRTEAKLNRSKKNVSA